jgi:hypothetical protein
VPAAEPSLTAEYGAYVSALPEGPAKENGLAAGQEVAARWLALRANDRFDLDVAYQQPPPGPGVWEPTAPTPPVDLKIAQVRPYVMRSPDRFRPHGPRRLGSRAYARAFDEVYHVNHPEYPSAHSCWTQAVTDTLAYFFGTDEAEFGLDSTVTGNARQYARFSEVAQEVQDGRFRLAPPCTTAVAARSCVLWAGPTS